MKTLTYGEAINEALREEMARDEAVIVYGEDVGFYGGPFKATLGLQETFGPGRVMDTPISETAIVGSAVGAAMTGSRPVVEIMHDAFLGVCMDEVGNQAAKMHYMTGGQAMVPLVVRTPRLGGEQQAAAQHTARPEAWFLHVPGLKIIIPATPADAKGLLKSAIRDDNPVLCFEHVVLYHTKGPVPEGEHLVPLGRARVVREGRDLTLVATSLMVHKAEAAAEQVAAEGIEVELIDPRSLVPFDWDTVCASVEKTGKLLVATEETKTGSVAAEIVARVAEEAFDALDAPPRRVCGLDVPLPFSPPLERYAVPAEPEIVAAVKAMMERS